MWEMHKRASEMGAKEIRLRDRECERGDNGDGRDQIATERGEARRVGVGVSEMSLYTAVHVGRGIATARQ